jgi:hypothetical protein
MPISNDHHYVPQWYQRQFLPLDGGEFFVLDKEPEEAILCPDGRVRKIDKRRNIFTCGPKKLFQQTGLYSVALRGVREDAIERLLFGRLDDKGARACQLFSQWPTSRGIGPSQESLPEQFGNPGHRMQDLLVFMNVQKFRTPKGITQIKRALATTGQIAASNNEVMRHFQLRRQVNCTVWAEGLWEIFSARQTATKFIISDDPVVIYNCDCYPQSEACRFPNDPDPFWRGSRVVYPLSPEHVLVITHNEHLDDPSRSKARRPRRNARSHDDVLISFLDILNYRTFSDEQVALVNHVIKARATRYVASIRKNDLYPEAAVPSPRWCEIDKLFHPEYPSFRTKTETMVSYKDRSVLYSNAFGERDVVPGWFVRQREAKRKAHAAPAKAEKGED